MELAWQKERDSQKKLINELNTMARDLKSTLLVSNAFLLSSNPYDLGVKNQLLGLTKLLTNLNCKYVSGG